MTDRCLSDRVPGPRNPSWGRGNRSRPPNRMLHLSSTGRFRESKVSALRFHSHPCNVLSRWPSTPGRLNSADDIRQNMQTVNLSLYQRRGGRGQPTGILPTHYRVHNCQHHTRFVKSRQGLVRSALDRLRCNPLSPCWVDSYPLDMVSGILFQTQVRSVLDRPESNQTMRESVDANQPDRPSDLWLHCQ